MARPPAQLGFRWPAEWEPHAATWVAWPHNPETWPGRLEQAVKAFAILVRELSQRETVRILVDDEPMEEAARRRLRAAGVGPDAAVEFHPLPTDDAWTRDYGPIFVVDERRGRRAALDFRFDAWGKKYGSWERDDAVARRVAERLGVEHFSADWVLEGGSVDGNGRGAILTTESCLLHANRGPGRSREAVERRLAEWLGATTVLWLVEGIAGDDTDGHVDEVARFVDAGTVVAALAEDAGDADYAPLSANLRRLRSMRDGSGKPLNVVPLPVPPPQRIDGVRCPASYANFYLANGAVLVPTFGAGSDARAQAVLAELLPGRDVIGIPCSDLVLGLGALHCLTQQEPAASAPRRGPAPECAATEARES